MKQVFRRAAFVVVALAISATAHANDGLQTVAPWQEKPAARFTVGPDGIQADGIPFPLFVDWPFTHMENDALLHYCAQLGGTVHYAYMPLALSSEQDWAEINKELDLCARNRLYLMIAWEVLNQDNYVRRHPEAGMVGPHGNAMPLTRDRVCFNNAVYREALGKGLASVASRMRNAPWMFGYYPQDECSYCGWGCYCPTCLKLFREQMLKKYGGLQPLNAAWKTTFAKPEDVQPPDKPELGRRWADWQESRRADYFDFCNFVYRTLKENDPNHPVAWSLDFWGEAVSATNWWNMPRCSDILMRHGIAYKSMPYNFFLLRDIAEWSGKPGNALCMPPGYYPSYEYFSLLLDVPRTGLSYVSPAAGDEAGPYKGAADPNHGYRRREPGYTTSRSFNDLVRILDSTYLQSRRLAPQVGYFISDRTAWVNGLNLSDVSGVLNMLGDLNLEAQTISEHDWPGIASLKVMIAEQGARLTSRETVKNIEAWIQAGGALVLTPGAFHLDENNEPVEWKSFALFDPKSVSERQIRIGNAQFSLPGGASLKAVRGEAAEVLAVTAKGVPVAAKVKVGKGEILAIGWEIGSPYLSAWTDDFAGVAEKESASVMEEQATGRVGAAASASMAAGPQRAVAVMVREFAHAHGVCETVQIEGYEKSVAAFRARLLKTGNDYLIGVANRIVKPGCKFEQTWPADYNVVQTGLAVSATLPEPANKLYGVVMPLCRPSGEGWSAMPQLIDVQNSTGQAVKFVLPRLEDAAMVVLSPSYRPVVGATSDLRKVAVGESLKLTARVLNPSDKQLSGELYVEGDPAGLTMDEQHKPFTIGPGQAFEAAFTGTVPLGAKDGYYLCQAVARVTGGEAIRSPSLEMDVGPIVRMMLTSADDQTIYPDSPVGNSLAVRLVPAAGAPTGDLTLKVEGTHAFQVERPERAITVDGKKEAYEETFSFAALPKSDSFEEVSLVLTGRLGNMPVNERQTVRVAKGGIAYYEDRPVKGGNGALSGPEGKLIVLENARIKARIIPRPGVVHSLVLRETNNDFLQQGMYPYGLVWYGWSDSWTVKEVVSLGPVVKAVLTSKSPTGHPVTMTISLGEKDDYLSVAYDASACEPLEKNIYIMSSLDIDTRQNTTYVPRINGIFKRPGSGSHMTIPAAELAAPWAAITFGKSNQVLSLSYRVDALANLQIESNSTFNTFIFALDAKRPPGRMEFRLAAQRGDLDQAVKLQEGLIRAPGEGKN